MTTKTTKTNRIYKDSLFKHVFANEKYKQFTLDLYNTLNQTNYTDPDAIEFITLEDVFYINVKNDAGFIIFNNMVLMEDQSTDNRNMPFRFLIYAAEEYKRMMADRNLNPAKNEDLKLPGAVCVMFYSGKKKYEDGEMLKFSNIVYGRTTIEVGVLVYNIGERIDTLKGCPAAVSYARITTDIHRKYKEGMSLNEAVDEVLGNLDVNDVLYPLIHAEYEAVKEMIGLQYTVEEFKKDCYEDGVKVGRKKGRAEGRDEGRTEGRDEKTVDVIVAMLKKNMHLNDIIEISNASEETVRSVAQKHGLHVEE